MTLLFCRKIPIDSAPLSAHNSPKWAEHFLPLSLWMTRRPFPASQLTTLKLCSFPIYTRFHSILSTAHPEGEEERRLSYTWFPWYWCVSALNRQMQMKQCMSMPLWGCEMGRSVLTHSCNHTHCGHPVYLAHPLALGCGISAHYWQLGISPGEHAFPMTNIPRAMGTHVCLQSLYKAAQSPSTQSMLGAWVFLGCHRGPLLTFRGHMR